jgi:hypothetical protein
MLLLVKDINGVLQLCKPCSLSVYVLPPDFSALDYCLPPYDGFLFLTKPLDLLLDSKQLLLCSSIFGGFFLPILQPELLKLCISLNYFY